MKIAIVGHRRPDGDAIGAMFGMRGWVKQTATADSYEISLVVPDPIPINCEWLPGVGDILVGNTEVIKEADIIICCDFSIPSRAGSLESAIRENTKAYKMSVDHHEDPDQSFWNKLIIEPSYSSTCEVICGINSFNIKACPPEVLTHLLNGIITDTKGQEREVSAIRAIRAIKKAGCPVTPRECAEKSIKEKTLNGFSLTAHIFSHNFFPFLNSHFAIITLPLEDKIKFSYQPGMTEGIVDKVLQIKGIETAFYLREEDDSHVKISIRGNDALTHTQDLFGGGGHKMRAGADWYGGSLQDAMALILGKLESGN